MGNFIKILKTNVKDKMCLLKIVVTDLGDHHTRNVTKSLILSPT